MSGFRRNYPLTTRSPGSYVNRVFVPGPSTAGFVFASIQPARLADYDTAKENPLGVDLSRTIRIYTSQRLNVYDRSTQNPGDIVKFLETDYIVFAESIWQSMGSSIDHYRYLATRDELTP